MKSIISALFLLIGAATGPAPESSEIPVNSHYVALGSSYAAGAGIGALVPDAPKRCGRTVNNYAHLLAERLRLHLSDVSCGGATTAHILSAWNELPAQIDAVTADTRLVTVTIGGNDVNYVRDLMLGMCHKSGSGPGVKRTCPVGAKTSESDWTSLEQRMRAIAREVRTRAPQSRLIFVDYLKIIPDNNICAAVPLDAEQIKNSRKVFRRLAALTAKVARQEGAWLLRAGGLSKDHEACSSDPWAVGYPGKPAPWHPTAAGHKAVADELERLIRSRRL